MFTLSKPRRRANPSEAVHAEVSAASLKREKAETALAAAFVVASLIYATDQAVAVEQDGLFWRQDTTIGHAIGSALSATFNVLEGDFSLCAPSNLSPLDSDVRCY